MNGSQVYRVTDTYGEELGKTVNAEKTLPPGKSARNIVCRGGGVDGLNTRRTVERSKSRAVFNSSACIKTDQKPGSIQQSQYVAHLDGHYSFTRQMDNLINSYGPLGERLVFVCDGAP